MHFMSVVVGGVLPYLAALVFIGGLVHRLRIWRKVPQPAKMTLFPAPTGGGLREVLAETFFFPSLFRGDRALWVFAWIFHASLALVLLGHFRVFSGLLDQGMFALGVSTDGVQWMSSTFGGAAGVVMLATAGVLLVRRLTTRRVRQISGFPDFFALLLLLSIIVSGDLMRFGGEHFDLALTRAWALSLLTLTPRPPEHATFLVHAMLAQCLFMYIPFSKIMHFGGIFFTQSLIKRR